MKYDVFISYRRETGKDYARIIKPELATRGLKVFLDFDELKDGKFDKRIFDAIESAPVFMIILSPGMLDRCVNENDWVRQEILHAENCKKQIIPVEVDKSFRSIPEQVPEDIKNIVGQHQFSQVDTETLLKASMDQLVQERIRPYLEDANVTVVGSGAEIHVETDCTCEVFRFTEKLGVAQKGKDTVFRLHKGTQKLVFRSLKFENAKVEKILKIPDEVYTDIVKVELASIESRIENEIEEKRLREQERIKAERARQRELEMEAKAKRLAEDERRRRASQTSTVQPASIKVTVKPALWPRWLAQTLVFCLFFVSILFFYFYIFDVEKWWVFALYSIVYAWLGYYEFHVLYRGDFKSNSMTKAYFKEKSYCLSYYEESKLINNQWNLYFPVIIVMLLFIAILAFALSVGFYFLIGLFDNLYVMAGCCFFQQLLLFGLGMYVHPILWLL